MALDPELLMNWQFEPVRQSYSEDDSIFYALSVGIGGDPTDERQLAYLIEGEPATMASMATVLATTGPWTANPKTGVTRSKLVHGAQWVQLHQHLPSSGTLEGHSRVIGVSDLGADKGAVIYLERTLFNVKDGSLVATLRTSSVCRADGGFGGESTPAVALTAVPDRAPDREGIFTTAPQQALAFRLNGDRNPLHSSPSYARSAGFEKPILHGLCTFGVANRALLSLVTGYARNSLATISARFSAPVFPGESLRAEVWQEQASVSFRLWSVVRGVKVLDQGHATLASAERSSA